MGQGLWGDDNSVHVLTRCLGAEFPRDGCSVCKGLQPPPSPASPRQLPCSLHFLNVLYRLQRTSQTGRRERSGTPPAGRARALPEKLLSASCKAERQRERRAASRSSHQPSAFLLASAISSAALAAAEPSQTACPKDPPVLTPPASEEPHDRTKTDPSSFGESRKGLVSSDLSQQGLHPHPG